MTNKRYKISFSALILVAGESSRFGIDKALLKFNENETFIDHLIIEYSNFGCEKIIVVANNKNASNFEHLYSNDKVKITINQNPENGRFSSIQTGINACNNADYLFISNVDNPFINNNLLQALSENIKHHDVIIPTYRNKGGHPVLISNIVHENIKNINISDFNFKEFLKNFTTSRLEVYYPEILANINTEEDYEKWFGVL